MKSVSVILAALAGLTIAAPAPDVATANARDVRVRFFTKDHYDGREYTDEADIGECRNVPREANDRIRSIKIDSDRARCTFYNNRSCRGDNFSPRRGTDVPVMDDEFKADISSYLCEERRREGSSGGGGGGGGGRDRDPPGRDGGRDGGRDRDRDRDRENDRDRERGRGGRP